MDILSSLNDRQRQAVTSIKGPILVISGPGSGKTRCLTHRVAYLIQQNIAPENILAVTFTNKAAQEMRERIYKLMRGSEYQAKTFPDIGTFHAICLQILRKEIDKIGYNRNFLIYNDHDQLSLIKQILRDLQISPEQFRPATVKEVISRAKDELIDAQEYQERAQEYFLQTVARIYQHYQDSLKKVNALDFDDLIMLTVRLFQKNKDVLEKYQEKWHYILVDEYQDINTIQYTLTNLLSKKHRNLFVIGDDSQAVYSWRGADFRNILNFEKDYADAKVILLEENYRSTKNILAASYQIISKNKERKEKNLWTNNPSGSLITLIEAYDQEQEGQFLIEEILNLVRQGFNLKDFAIFYRTNAQSRAVEEAFLRANLPYKIIGTVKFYERKEIKDILSYLKFIAYPQDAISLQRIANVPPRRLGKTTFERYFNALIKNEKIDVPQNQPIYQFQQLINNLRKSNQEMKLTKLIKTVIKETHYQEYLREFSQDRQDEERRQENIQELFTVASKYDKLKPARGLESFLEEISLLSSQDEIETQKDLVNLMTLHCAKGLEFPVIFMVGCEEGIFPHSKSLFSPEQMEEERRLCYVGITRAQQKAYLSFVKRRLLYGQIMVNPPSRFLQDISEDLIEFKEFNGY